MIAARQLILRVREIINEVATEGDDFSEMIDEALLSFVQMAAPMLIIEVSPIYLFSETVNYLKSDTRYFFTRPDGMTAIKLPVPEDFCRFISFHAESFPTPANIVYSDMNPLFKNQYSPVPGIGAGPSSPFVFLSSELDNEGILKSHIIAHAVKQPESFRFSYVKTPEISEEQVNMDIRLQDALAYYTASLYLQSIGDLNGSKSAFDAAGALVQHLNNIAIV